MEYFQLLPEEISLEILTRLPTEAVLDSKLVCRNWRKMISHHPSFSGMHLHHLNHPASSESAGNLGFIVLTYGNYGVRLHYFEYDDQSKTPIQRITRINFTSPFKHSGFRLVGSMNGLVCLLAQRHSSVYICNPITRECVMLPEIKTDSDTDWYTYEETSFGYVSSTNEYKVLRIYKSETHLKFHIYTLGSGNGWRNLGDFICGSSLYLEQSVFFANGTFYWLDKELKMIGTFDLAEEKFGGHLSPPALPPDSYWYDYKIGVLDGFLYFALENKRHVFNDIWLFKKKNHNHNKEEGKEHQSLVWNKEFRIDGVLTDLLAVPKSGGVFTRDGRYLYIYGTKTSTWKCLVKFNNYIAQVSTHKNTLVSLKELGEEDTKVMESAEIEETKSREQLQKDADPEYIYL